MHPPSGATQVLIVDDEALIRWAVAQAFDDRGFGVIEAADARSALRLAAEAGDSLCAVFLDFRLPDSSDLTLLSKLHALLPDACIVLMTAFGTPEIRDRALSLGAAIVIDKPFEIVPLVQKIARRQLA